MLVIDDLIKSACVELGVGVFFVGQTAMNQEESSINGTQICGLRIP